MATVILDTRSTEAKKMLHEKKPVITNEENWGLHNETLAEVAF